MVKKMSMSGVGQDGRSFEDRLALKERRRKEAGIGAGGPGKEPDAPSRAEWWPLPGLAPMTRVKTIFGDVHAVALRKGDEVLTRSGEYKPIVWLNRVLLDPEFLVGKPDGQPVVIRAGALGPDLPASDIMVSPRQLVFYRHSSWPEAASLIGRPGVERVRETGLSYTMFHLGGIEDVVVEGAIVRTAPPNQ